MTTNKPFFYICVGMTIALPIFYGNLAVIETFANRRDSVVTTAHEAPVMEMKQSVNLRGVLEPPNESQMTPASGQHLLLDLQGSNFDFLNDEEGLKRALLNIIDHAHMHLLGIQSAKLEPQGVSAVAMLAESHLSIHTWPEFGSALVDLFTCGNGAKLSDELEYVVGQFHGNLTASTYSIIPRGTFTNKKHILEDRQYQPVEIMTVHKWKNKVVEVQSPYQHIAIYDHHDTQEDDFDVNPMRSLFLDGVIQSNSDDEATYHESLVHPAFMASVKDPKRVLIIGGGEGGTLRESLMYKSVDHVTMVDLDEKVMEVSRKYLPSYSNCTGFGTSCCFDDPRATVVAQDFFVWFEENMGHNICDTRTEHSEKLYDVIILDLLDPEALPEGADFAKYLYSEKFFRHISCSLNNQGVMVSNFGEAPSSPFLSDTDKVPTPFVLENAEMFYDKLKLVQNLSKNFHNTRVYDVAVSSYRANWAFAMGIVPRGIDDELESDEDIEAGVDIFDASPAVINDKLKSKLLPKAKLDYYDGSIQNSFKYPLADWKGVYCFYEDNKEMCKDPIKVIKKMDSYERSIWHPLVEARRDELDEL